MPQVVSHMRQKKSRIYLWLWLSTFCSGFSGLSLGTQFQLLDPNAKTPLISRRFNTFCSDHSHVI